MSVCNETQRKSCLSHSVMSCAMPASYQQQPTIKAFSHLLEHCRHIWVSNILERIKKILDLDLNANFSSSDFSNFLVTVFALSMGLYQKWLRLYLPECKTICFSFLDLQIYKSSLIIWTLYKMFLCFLSI